MHAKGAKPVDNTENDSKGVGHGTGVLAKACGWKHGSAKRANPIIVRISDLSDPAAWLDGVRLVYNDWRPIYDKDVSVAVEYTHIYSRSADVDAHTAKGEDRNHESLLGMVTRCLATGWLR